MITIVGFSPAWQQVYCVDQIASGQVLRAGEAFSYASGKPTNAAVVASQSTEQVVHLVTVSGGPLKRVFESDLCRHRLKWTCLGPATTRVCTTVCPADGRSMELIENAGPLSEAIVDDAVACLTDEPPTALLCTGSLPPGLLSSTYQRLLETCRGPSLVDAAGPVLREALSSGPTLVKPNRAELAATLGIALPDDLPPDSRELVAAMRQLIDEGADAVLVTNGSRPASLLTKTELVVLTPPVARLVNPIGAGDTLAGTTLAALAEGATLADAVRKGLEAASEKCGRMRPERPSTASQSDAMN